MVIVYSYRIQKLNRMPYTQFSYFDYYYCYYYLNGLTDSFADRTVYISILQTHVDEHIVFVFFLLLHAFLVFYGSFVLFLADHFRGTDYLIEYFDSNFFTFIIYYISYDDKQNRGNMYAAHLKFHHSFGRRSSFYDLLKKKFFRPLCQLHSFYTREEKKLFIVMDGMRMRI